MDAYDEFLYPNYCYPQTHPDHLCSLGLLFGMQPAPVAACRVLELACGDGANLLPVAFNLPRSHFLGIDRAADPIVRGNKFIAELGLKNIELKQADILELPARLGEFDYIIAHGLYSWVPRAVQQRVLEICRASLRPQGIAYISYNVYPGCHLREIGRDVMQFHTRDVQNATERVAQARAIIQWLAEASMETNAYKFLLRDLSESLKTRDKGAIYHDDLAEINAPVYFYQFVTEAARHGLKFLSEAEYFRNQANLKPEIAAQLDAMEHDDIVSKEQYLDFIEGRSFRQTVLCQHEVDIDRSINPEVVANFFIRGAVNKVKERPDLKSEDVIEEFRGPKQSLLTTSLPLAKAAMVHLETIYPRSLAFSELLSESLRLLDNSTTRNDLNEPDVRNFAEVMLKAYGAGVIELHLHQPKISAEPSERPRASPLARIQNRYGPILTSMLYITVKFEDVAARELVSLLDGTRTLDMIAEDFSRIVEKNLPAESDHSKVIEDLLPPLQEKLLDLARLGFLIE
ncbi:MAG: methyltransferase regulatory domain-containing protein [Pyrinomonadaceae bacterium]